MKIGDVVRAPNKVEGRLLRWVNRNGQPRPEDEALYCVLAVGDPPIERQVRWRGLVLVEAARPEVSPENPQASAPSTVPVAACDEPVDYWKANERAGAIYLDREPAGTYRAALVLPRGDGRSTQAAGARDLSADDLEDQLLLLVRRLMRSVRGG
jgi:hypothetical protein